MLKTIIAPLYSGNISLCTVLLLAVVVDKCSQHYRLPPRPSCDSSIGTHWMNEKYFIEMKNLGLKISQTLDIPSVICQ